MKVGLIGLGVMGRNHLRVLATLPDAEIVAISDPVDVAREAATSSCSAAVIAANIGSERQPFANASVTGSATSRPRSLMYGCWLTGIG